MPTLKDLPELRRMGQRNIRTLSKVNASADYYEIKLAYKDYIEEEKDDEFGEFGEADNSVPACIYEELFDLDNSQPLDPALVDYIIRWNNLLDLNEIVIKEEEITILFAVPFPTVYKYKYKSKNGFTRLDLLRCIYEGFDDIFNAYETNDISIGHEFGDLLIEGVWYNTKFKTVEMVIGS